MRWVCLILLALVPWGADAQTREVFPDDLHLEVRAELADTQPLTREMVLITIRGTYRRHITRETLFQPDFDGVSWSQLGPDAWRDARVDGQQVKIFERRMAVYPNRSGKITIGAFRHALTLTDDRNGWFEHDVFSEPITLDVAAAPDGTDWWFPVRRLRISDQWSNAPDQLQPGQGVLRVLRIEALGATPEMIPPMPALTSPSGMIFPHPEQRLVELTPEGPVTYAFWRWTIRPTNDVSAILEPITLRYFDTQARRAREVTISAQRVAYGDVVPQPQRAALIARPASLPGLWALAVFLATMASGVVWLRAGQGLKWRQIRLFDGLIWRLWWAARTGSVAKTRRAAHAILRRDCGGSERAELVREFDRKVFDPKHLDPDLTVFARQFLQARNIGEGR